MKYDVFISHSSADLEVSEKIYDYLQAQGIKCWIDSRNITGLYARSIIEGIEDSELVVLVYSSKTNESAHVENEIDNAFCLGKMIIPFRIEGAPYSNVLRYYLNKSHYVDGIPEPSAAFETLIDQIRRNMSEQKRLKTIDEALNIVAEWSNMDADTLRKLLKKHKNHDKDQSDNFEKHLNEFINNELSDIKAEPDNPAATKENNKEKKQRYDILKNSAGEIMIIINSFDSEPENPRIVYDGGDSVLLYRNKESATILEHINNAAREPLMKVDEVLIVEIENDDVAREYKTPMRKIKQLKSLY